MGGPGDGGPRIGGAGPLRSIRSRGLGEGLRLNGPALGPRFQPAEVEARWQAAWNERARAPAHPPTRNPAFTIILPPPNVTGVLTLGHMLGGTVMDLLVRWHRMRGETALWVPSIDHAGLSTQVEVRRRLAKGGVRFESLSREEALAKVEDWKREHETRILEQLGATGFGLDWSRYRYTMDEAAVRATRTAFVDLFDAGLIYRGERLINWDPRLHTALSDLEVVHTEEAAELLYLEYPWADGSPGGLTVATVRPETIFGDVAVAVHPEDERHRADVGRSVRVPLTDRAVPVITDAAIDPTFGNGALKVTPRHDLVDYDVFRRHPELAMPLEIFDPSAHLTGEAVPAPFRGMERDDARRAVTEALAADGRLTKREPYRHSVGRSERSDAVVEPRLSTQWFVNMRAIAEPAVAAVRDGTIKLHPERWTLTFFRWMEGLEDWCISRQVLWGHPIPVYYCDACGTMLAAIERPELCRKCGATTLRADPDVLDTWFTSWLWPFAVLGWPESTPDLSRFYPTSVLVTGRDIMFFWVARMMIAGYRFTGKPPFSDVYFTGMLRDEHGRRMSKHLGNSPDPLDVIRARGADALRFAVLFPNPVDQDGPFGAGTLDGARNFLTKLWNVVRFATQQLPADVGPSSGAPDLAGGSLADRWILSRWSRTAEELDAALAAYEFTQAATLLHGFLWHDVADRYVELAKEALQGKAGAPAARVARATLLFVLERALRQLHPMAPHVTEELWHALPHEGELLAEAAWPSPSDAPRDPEAEVAMGVLLDAIRAFRNLRAENDVPIKDHPDGFVRPAGPEEASLLRSQGDSVTRLAHLGQLQLLDRDHGPPEGTASQVVPSGEYYLKLPASARAGTDSLRRERAKLEELLDQTKARLDDPTFRAKAPAEVVRAAEEKAKELGERLQRIATHLGVATGAPVDP